MLNNFKNKIIENFEKCKSIFRERGLYFLFVKILFYPITLLYRFVVIFRFRFMSIENRFLLIYKNNYWKSNESISGVGSTIIQTENLRKKLPIILEDLKIKSLLDAPCGDFNWMQHVLNGSKINYTGIDIVSPLIKELNKKYSSDSVKFIHKNLLEQPLPYCDLLISRDFLFHLSYKDINKFIKNYIESNIPYILTTTHHNLVGFLNHDIVSGDYRKIDLFSAPFKFPVEVLYNIQDYKKPEPPRSMCLWSRSQILEAYSNIDKLI